MMYALIDCNNFYASCERLFRPDLAGKSIVVLSNNDGCVIARSNEAKNLGIAMGEPFFKIKALCKQHQIYTFSSNYTLYGDLSQRVMSTIEAAWPYVEIYSIDEAFLDLSTMPLKEQENFCISLQKKILKDTGIPTSIGIGLSKTLAKIANHLCKKVLKTPVMHLYHNHEIWLKQIAIGDVWGVGRQWQKKLIAQGIITAYDLAKTNVHVLKKKYNVILMRTTMELQGTPCAGLEDIEPKQSIMASRSFGQMQTEFSSLAEAISSHCARAVEKLRAQNLVTPRLMVFIQTNRFRDDLAQYYQAMEGQFIIPTADLRLITHMAKQCLKKIFKPGLFYKKAGVCLEELLPNTVRQYDLFHEPRAELLEKNECVMRVFDNINQKFGRKTIWLAAEGSSRSWVMRAELKSPAYTTRLSELAYARV